MALDISRPRFLITIDTEGDNLWGRPRCVTTKNSSFLPRFQNLCERYRFKPTWLTNYEMAQCPVFREFGREILARGTGEIGMHLHAWNSPPLVPLTNDDERYQPYLVEYPVDVMRQKISYLTKTLEDEFQCAIRSHRAGRWAFNQRYQRILQEHGYQVDCSVTPHVDWREKKGAPTGQGGMDYTDLSVQPQLLNQGGDPGFLEVPVSIVRNPFRMIEEASRRLPWRLQRTVRRYVPSPVWMRPNGDNLRWMLFLLRQAVAEQWPCVQFVLHSSELMPGGSPRFRTSREIERLYGDLELTFSAAARSFDGASLLDFFQLFARSAATPPARTNASGRASPNAAGGDATWATTPDCIPPREE